MKHYRIVLMCVTWIILTSVTWFSLHEIVYGPHIPFRIWPLVVSIIIISPLLIRSLYKKNKE